MKVCIDGLGASRLSGTGLCTYTRELIDNLLNIYPQPQYEILWDTGEERGMETKHKNISYLNLSLNRYKGDYNPLSEYLAQTKTQIYHSPNNGFSIPEDKTSKYVMTVHDTLPLSMGQYVDKKYNEKFMNIFPNSVDKCDSIVAVSNFIKNELLDHYDISEEKVAVIHPGCSHIFTPIDSENSKSFLKNKYSIEGDFLLYAGSIHPRKNLPVLLKAFKLILKETRDNKLVILGKNDGKREEYYLYLKNMVKQLGMEDNIIFTGMVDYLDMPYFYNSAVCFINISSYEGFPMSSVEAMACGTPAICLRNTSFYEICGEGAVYIDSLNENSLKDTLLNTIFNKKYRNAVADKGMSQSGKYRWDNSIKKLINIYESIAYSN